MNIDLTGKRVVITGAARGIGLRLSQRFADERASVAMVDVDRAVQSAAASVAGARAYVCDVSDPKSVSSTFTKANDELGGIDVLINNAGIAPAGTLEKMSAEEWDATYAVNARGIFLCCRAAAPFMKGRRWGRILNASSFAAIIPSFAFAAYASSKSAVVSMTRVFASELGPFGITVNAYAPGMVPTTMNGFADATPERQQQLLDTLAVRRWESADDVADLLIFLASEQARYITGALIDVSGGKFSTQFPQAAYQQAGV